MTQTPRQRFAAQLASGEMITAPGCYDGLTASLIERAGFKACYMTGAGTASGFGLPDYGLLTATEMVANAARIAAAVDIPVIADADTGFGNELNVTRAIRDYERAGVAAIHIEDQGFPKKCGHLDDKEIIPLDAYLAKIRAAAAARTDPDFKIIVRTDSNAMKGFDEAITRVNAALAAGAGYRLCRGPQNRRRTERRDATCDWPLPVQSGAAGQNAPRHHGRVEGSGLCRDDSAGCYLARNGHARRMRSCRSDGRDLAQSDRRPAGQRIVRTGRIQRLGHAAHII